MSREHVLKQLGEYCTTHICKTCPIMEMAHAHHHGCPEGLRIPAIANMVEKIIRREKVEKEEQTDGN